MRQTLSRARRPPELNIKKKSQLRESPKVKIGNEKQGENNNNAAQEFKPLFKVMVEDAPEKAIEINVIEQK